MQLVLGYIVLMKLPIAVSVLMLTETAVEALTAMPMTKYIFLIFVTIM